MEEKNNNFFKTYYILMVSWAIIGIFDSFFAYFNETFGDVLIWSMATSLFSLAIIVLSIVAIVKFKKYQFAKITLFIPIYHLVFLTLLFVAGIVWGIKNTATGTTIETQTIPTWFTVVGIISSLFELIFSGYLLNRFKK